MTVTVNKAGDDTMRSAWRREEDWTQPPREEEAWTQPPREEEAWYIAATGGGGLDTVATEEAWT